MNAPKIAPVVLAGRFTVPMLVVTTKPIDNTPPEIPGMHGKRSVLRMLTKLCEDLLVPIEALPRPDGSPLGIKLWISSGYRSRAVNAAVGGDPASAHLEGRAADCGPDGLNPWVLFRELAHRRGMLPFDKVIFERRFSRGGILSEWVHLQVGRDGATPRRKIYFSPNPTAWIELDAFDPRLDADRAPTA